MPKPKTEVKESKHKKNFGLRPQDYVLLKHQARREMMIDIEKYLMGDIMPQDPRVDPMTEVYDEICNRQREQQDYFIPIGLSPWQVRKTILTVKQLGTGVERNVILRRLLEEICKSLLKVIADGNYGRPIEDQGTGIGRREE